MPNVAGMNDINFYTSTSHCSHPHQCVVNTLFAHCGKATPCATVTSAQCELYPAGYSTADVVLFNVAVALFFAAAVALELRLVHKRRKA